MFYSRQNWLFDDDLQLTATQFKYEMNSDYEEGSLLDSDEEATHPREESERNKNRPKPKVAKDINEICPSEKAIRTSKRGKVWTHEETVHLIELLEENSCLWNIFEKAYHSRESRNKALSELGDILGISTTAVKAKILKLRSQLGREVAKVNKTRSGQSTSKVYKLRWAYWELLQFLKPVLQPGKSRDNLHGTLNSEPGNSPESDCLEKAPRLSRKRTLQSNKEELMSACIDVLKKPPESPSKTCHFSFLWHKNWLRWT